MRSQLITFDRQPILSPQLMGGWGHQSWLCTLLIGPKNFKQVDLMTNIRTDGQGKSEVTELVWAHGKRRLSCSALTGGHELSLRRRTTFLFLIFWFFGHQHADAVVSIPSRIGTWVFLNHSQVLSHSPISPWASCFDKKNRRRNVFCMFRQRTSRKAWRTKCTSSQDEWCANENLGDWIIPGSTKKRCNPNGKPSQSFSAREEAVWIL